MASSRPEEMAGRSAGKRKVVAPLLRFLKTTDLGERDGWRAMKLEWERKNDQGGEDLLG